MRTPGQSLMRIPIDLYDQPSRQSREVRNIGTDRRLAAESRAVRPDVAEHVLHVPFGFRQLAAKPAGTLKCDKLDI